MVQKIEGGGSGKTKRLDPIGGYKKWDAKKAGGWLPGGADNPVTTILKGAFAGLTGIVPLSKVPKKELPELKTWEDRNVNNIGTKLNP